MLDIQDFICAVGYCMGDKAKIDKQNLIDALHQLYETEPKTYDIFQKNPFYGTNDYVSETLISLASCSYLHMVWNGKSDYYEVNKALSGASGKSYYDKLIEGQRKAAKSVALILMGKNLLESPAKNVKDKPTKKKSKKSE